MQPLSHNVPSRLAGTQGNVNSQSKPRRPLRMLGLAILVLAVQFAASPLRVFSQLVPLKSISTLAGNGTRGFSGDGGPASQAQLNFDNDVAVDGSGNVYVADTNNNRIRVISPNGVITTFLGDGTAGYAGDGGALSTVEFNAPVTLAIDGSGNLYIGEFGNCRIRKYSAATQVVTTIAGVGPDPVTQTCPVNGDGGPATSAGIGHPQGGLAVDLSGNVYLSDGTDSVREVNAATGTITTVAGRIGDYGNNQIPLGDGGPATSAAVNPYGLTVDSKGNLYIADSDNRRVRMVSSATGIISTVAGNGNNGNTGDGGLAVDAEVGTPFSVKLDTGGNLYVADTTNYVIRMVAPSTGIITTIAGNGNTGFTGSGGPAINAELGLPVGLATDRFGNLFIVDSANNTLDEVSPFTPANTNVGASSAPQNLYLQTTAAETITGFTVPASQGGKQEYTAGMVTGCAVDGTTSNPAGTICTVPITFSPAYPGVRPVPLQAVTSGGNINIGLNGIGVGPLVAFSPGVVNTLAGNYSYGGSGGGDGGPATAAKFHDPTGIAVDYAGNIYIADEYDSEVRRIDATTGTISRYAGSQFGNSGYSGDGGPAASAQISEPFDLAFDNAGNLYFADGGDHVVRKVDAATGIITTVAGQYYYSQTLEPPSNGDGGPATQALLNQPYGIALDRQGNNLYISDTEGNQIRKVDLTTGIISTLAGTGTQGYTGDGGPAISATLDHPLGVAVDPDGNVYFADNNTFPSSEDNVVRRVDAVTGIITTYAGNPSAPYTGQFPTGPATSINIGTNFLRFDSAGNLYITSFEDVTRVDAATGLLSNIAIPPQFSSSTPTSGQLAFGYGGGLDADPSGIAIDAAGSFYLCDTYYIQKIDVTNSGIDFFTITQAGTPDTTDDPQTANVANIGNAELTLAAPSAGTNPVVSPASYSFATATSNACPQVSASSAPGTLDPGSSCTIALDFEPTAGGTNLGTVVLTDNSLNAGPATSTPYATQTIPVYGRASGGATLLPGTLNFGSVAVGSSSMTQTATFTNANGAALTLSAPSLTDSTDFSESDNCNGSVAASGSCTLTFTFTPKSAGALASTFTVSDTTSGTHYSVALTGTGISPGATLAPASLSFTATAGGPAAASQTATLTNAGSAALSVSSIAITGANASSFTQTNNCGATLAVNASCTITVSFTGTAAGSYAASLVATDNATPATQSTSLTGIVTAPVAALTPASLSFTTVAGTTPAAQTATLTNSGNAALAIASIAITGANAASFTQTNNCGASLAAGANCAVTVSFAGATAGSYAAALTVTDNSATPTQTAALSGTVTAAPAPVAALTPATLTYSAAAGSASAAQVATLTNSGNAALSISGITLTGANAASFTQTNTCGASLAAGASCAISVTFTPGSAGSFTAALSVADNAAGSPQTSALAGTATAPADFTVAATPATQSVAAGSAAAYTVQVASTGGSFTSAVALTATGVPQGATVTFAPASVTPGAAGGQSTMTVQTAAAQTASIREFPRGRFSATLAAPVFAAVLLLIPGWRARRRWNSRAGRGYFTGAGCLLVLLGMMAAITGCGGGFALPQSPAATYTITVTGTSGPVQHTTTVQITVR